MQIADVDGQPRAAFVSRSSARRPRRAEGAVGPLHGPHLPFLERASRSTQEATSRSPDRSRVSAPRCRRPPGAGRLAGGRAGHGQRRRRHRRRGARRSAARPQGEALPVFTVGVGARRYQETSRSAASHAEDRAQGHDADGRRGAVAVRLRRPEGHARRRRRGHAGQHATGDAARRRRRRRRARCASR